jgi:hypothetical protein
VTQTKKDLMDLPDVEVDVEVLKKLRRDPIPFDVLLEKLDTDPDLLRESLMRLGEAGLAEIDPGFGWKRRAPRPRMTKKMALGVVLDAADSWARELMDYIIPADEDSDSEDDLSTALSRKDQVDDIYKAIKLLGEGTRE